MDDSNKPCFVLEANHFLRDALFDVVPVDPEAYLHRPLIVTDPNARLGDVIGKMRVEPESLEDDVIDNDLILVWGIWRLL